jgi:cytoskeleton protein RodZ
MSDMQIADPALAAEQTGAHEESPAPTPTAPGAWLAAAREARGLTIDQVASQLNFAPRQVLALEADDYAALPGMVIVRGFLRSYAKLLKVDPTPLLALLVDKPTSATAPMRHALSASFSETRLPTLSGSGKRSKTMPVVAGVAVLAIAAAATYALGWWPEALSRKVGQFKLGALTHDGAAPVSAPAEPSGESVTTLPSTVAPVVADSTSAPAAASSVTPLPAVGADAAPSPSAAPAAAGALPPATAIAAASKPDAVAAAPASAATAPVASSAATTLANPLVLNIQQDSWIEIKRADNTPVVAKVIKAGSVETFDVAEPVTLTVGNIAGVEATLRGTPLELASVATGNVARLKLK